MRRANRFGLPLLTLGDGLLSVRGGGGIQNREETRMKSRREGKYPRKKWRIEGVGGGGGGGLFRRCGGGGGIWVQAGWGGVWVFRVRKG